MTDRSPTPRARPVRTDHPTGIRELTVIRRESLTPRMVRVVLGGEDLAGFESHTPDEHVKLVFPDAVTGAVRLPTADGPRLVWPRPLPPSRDYTVRHYDDRAHELWIDFVVHEGGLASDWAGSTSPGERLHVVGPPAGAVIAPTTGRVLLAGDETALPAIARWLEELPASTTGHAVVEVTDVDDELTLRRPGGVNLSWLHRGTIRDPDLLMRHLSGLDVVTDDLYAWVAGEAASIRPVRRWLREELSLGRDACMVTGYWKA